jgi:hypothetical protein
MERYKGSRLTASDAAPSKAAFSVDDTETVELPDFDDMPEDDDDAEDDAP